MTREASPADVISGDARWCVVEGDALALLASLPDGAVDHVITDPPYNARTHAGAKAKGGELVERSTIEFASLESAEFFADCLRAAARWCLAFCAAEQLAAYEGAAGGAWIRAGAWIRIGAAPQFTGDRPATGFDAVAIAHRPGRKRWNGGGRHAVWSHGFQRDEVGDGRGHPTRKPLALMRELVRDFTDPGEVILDPFAGSGTTGVAALAEGRRVILVERVPEYAEIARRRCEAAAQGTDWRADPRQLGLSLVAEVA